MSHLSEREVFAKTLYAEARGEPEEGQIWVLWVIKNRARFNKPYWGGNSIKNVCLQPGMFECWNGQNDIAIHERSVYENRIIPLANRIYDANPSQDPTGGADHYHNPNEGHRGWIDNCYELRTIGHHIFYRSKYL